jgi:hypothetical protein
MLLHSTYNLVNLDNLCKYFLFRVKQKTLKIKLREQHSQAEQQSQAEQVHLTTPLMRSSQIRLKFV